MEKITANKLLEQAMALNEKIGALDLTVSEMPDGREKEHYVKVLGTIIGAICNGIMHPIVQEYPDLDPYK